jgi:hypothetical protein
MLPLQYLSSVVGDLNKVLLGKLSGTAYTFNSFDRADFNDSDDDRLSPGHNGSLFASGRSTPASRCAAYTHEKSGPSTRPLQWHQGNSTTRCATCVRAGHTCSSTLSIQLSRSHGSLPAVQARVASAETVLGHRIGIFTESFSRLQNTQVEISNLQVELDILRRRRTRMRSYEYSSSPRGASSAPAFSEISSVPNASGTIMTGI